MSVTLGTSVDAPSPVATPITWMANVDGASDGTLWYRFRVRRGDQAFHIIRDSGPVSYLDWTATDHEGLYEMEVSVRNIDTGEIASASLPFLISPIVTGADPLINPTLHPLVFLYSAPPCAPGSHMRVEFQASGGPVQRTPFESCEAGLTMNFYLAGLLANTTYTARYFVNDGSPQPPPIAFATGDSGAPPDLIQQTVLTSRSNASKAILVASSFVAPTATDAAGNLLWYVQNGISFITNADPGGAFWGISEPPKGAPSEQLIRKFDLTGMTLLETNAARVNEQLAQMGRRPISGFHHEAGTLPDGRIVALASVEQILTDVQGPGPVNVLGDMIVVFDKELNVVWAWDTFDYLDVSRPAVLGEVCTIAGGGCPPFNLTTNANDWTHGNSVQQTPDGQLLYSTRHQDWVIKIDYSNGSGDGHIIWKLGKDGDFRFDSADPYPWFSHQHDANFSGPSTMLVFDNGNTRVGANQGGNSRGQVIKLDESSRTATFVLNADLGVYSLALGTAQTLPGSKYQFDAGYVIDPSCLAGSCAFSLELDSSGTTLYLAKASAIVYRWFRMVDLYTPI